MSDLKIQYNDENDPQEAASARAAALKRAAELLKDVDWSRMHKYGGKIGDYEFPAGLGMHTLDNLVDGWNVLVHINHAHRRRIQRPRHRRTGCLPA